MVEAVAARPPRPAPADLPHLVAVDGAERVDEAVLLEAASQRQLRLVPPLAPFRSQPAMLVAGERPDRPVGVLPARRVEVAAHKPRAVRLPGQVAEHRLVGEDLGQPRPRADRRMDVDHLGPVPQPHGQDPLRHGKPVDGHDFDRLAVALRTGRGRPGRSSRPYLDAAYPRSRSSRARPAPCAASTPGGRRRQRRARAPARPARASARPARPGSSSPGATRAPLPVGRGPASAARPVAAHRLDGHRTGASSSSSRTFRSSPPR